MKNCPDCKRTLPATAFTSNKKTKDGLCVYCRECMAARNRKYWKEKSPEAREAALVSRRNYKEANREKLLTQDREKYSERQEYKKAKCREYYHNEEVRPKLLEYAVEYRKTHAEQIAQWRKESYLRFRGRILNAARERQYNIKQRTFAHEKTAIELFYQNCPEGHHVDHIVPLKNPLVSGLHVLANLQYLPAIDNLKKRNKFEVVV